MKDLIVIIANKFSEEDIMKAANEAGAHGGTVIHGHGTANQVQLSLLGLTIDPEKEVILVVVNREITKILKRTLTEKFIMEEPNKGILFVMPIKKYRGVFEG